MRSTSQQTLLTLKLSQTCREMAEGYREL